MGEAVKAVSQVHRIHYGWLTVLGGALKLDSLRVKVVQIVCDAVVLEVPPLHGF
jgi:hypothetical protein